MFSCNSYLLRLFVDHRNMLVTWTCFFSYQYFFLFSDFSIRFSSLKPFLLSVVCFYMSVVCMAQSVEFLFVSICCKHDFIRFFFHKTGAAAACIPLSHVSARFLTPLEASNAMTHFRQVSEPLM